MQEVAGAVRQSLEQGRAVAIDHLGVFRPAAGGGFEFVAHRAPSVFLSYAEEDYAVVERLYGSLARAGLRPWLDKKSLLAGQNWPRAIERAIDLADFVVVCLSRRSATKRGVFQSELRYALDCARRLPLEDVFMLPARLEECRVPAEIRDHIHCVDLFPDFGRGVRRLVRAMRAALARRARQEPSLA